MLPTHQHPQHLGDSLGYNLIVTLSLCITLEHVHWEMYYHPQESPVKLDISAGDFLWEYIAASGHPQKCPHIGWNFLSQN